MCAGVQNVSRPMERCQEISQWPPIMAEVTARTAHQIYQGTVRGAAGGDATGEVSVEVAAMCPSANKIIDRSLRPRLGSMCKSWCFPTTRVVMGDMAESSRKALRSQEWWAQPNYESFTRRAWMRAEGFTAEVFQNRPVIGICNSWSELNNCNAHLRTVAEAVKRGVWAAGGFPLEFPTISLGEVFMRPTTMLYRNLMSMDVEESIRANPIDGVVLLCGCDKTTPAQLMGAASADLPAIVVTGGPMLSGQWRERKLGAGTDGRKLFDLFRAGKLSEEELCEVEGGIARSAGHCTVMGTASTMACVAEALGMTLPGCAAIPAPDSRRLMIAEQSGQRIVDMVWEDIRPSRIMTREAIENAIAIDMAIGGSTNAVVHLLAIAGRLGIDLKLEEFDRISRRT